MNSGFVKSLQSLAARPRALFVVSLVLILALKWPALVQPPVWDEAASVFPAAITLVRSGFDFGALAGLPGYAQGGPNCHAFSLVTWYTACVLALTGGGTLAWVILHAVQFVMGALFLTVLLLLARPLVGAPVALVVAAAAFCQPMIGVQFGYMYLEVPMLALSTAAFLAYARGRYGVTAVLITLAVWCKETGVIAAGALILAPLVEGPRWRPAMRRAALLAVGPLAVMACNMLIFVPAAPPRALGVLQSITFTLRLTRNTYLQYVPDVFLCAAGGLLLALVMLPAACRELGAGRPDAAAAADDEARARRRTRFLAAATVVLFCGFHFIAVPIQVGDFAFLPRYLVQLLPFAFLLFAGGARRLFSERATVMTGLLVVGLFLANRSGWLYGYQKIPFDNAFGLAERSEEYLDAYLAQRDGVRALAALPPEVPLFYSLPEHYLLQYPEMGYAPGPLAQGHCLFHEAPYNRPKLQDFPPQFYLFYFYPWLGGQQARHVAAQAQQSPDHRLEEVAVYRHGRYYSVIMRVGPVVPPSPPP